MELFFKHFYYRLPVGCLPTANVIEGSIDNTGIVLLLAVQITILKGSPHLPGAKERKNEKKGPQKKGNFTAD